MKGAFYYLLVQYRFGGFPGKQITLHVTKLPLTVRVQENIFVQCIFDITPFFSALLELTPWVALYTTSWYTYTWATCAWSCATQGSNVVLPMHKLCTVVGKGLLSMAAMTFKIW